MSQAFYPISADPITNGHIDIIRRAANVFDTLVVGIAQDTNKHYLFSSSQRLEMAQIVLQDIPNVTVVSYEGLTVDYAWEQDIPVIIRGMRGLKDLEPELEYQYISVSQDLGIEFMPFFAKQEMLHISSSAVKSVIQEQGLIHNLVPLLVKQALEMRVHNQHVIGITGEIAAGKSYIANSFVELGKNRGIEVHNIDLDTISHEIVSVLDHPRYQKIRQQIFTTFGNELKQSDGSVDRKKLGELVFEDRNELRKLEQILWQPVFVRLRRAMYKKSGLILLNAALLAESKMAALCNNTVILVSVDKTIQHNRLEQRGLNDHQIERRLACQYTFEQKQQALQSSIEHYNFGKTIVFDNSQATKNDIELLFHEISNFTNKQ